MGGRHPHHICCLWTLQSSYIVPGLVSTGFTGLHIYIDILLELSRFLRMVSIRFSWLTTKFRKASCFKVTFSSLFDYLKDFPFFQCWCYSVNFDVGLYWYYFGLILYRLDEDNAVSLAFVLTKPKCSLDKNSKLQISL